MSDLQFACKKTVKVEPNGISDKKPPRLQVQQDLHTAAHTSFSAAKALHLETQMQQCILQLHPKQHTAVRIHSTTQHNTNSEELQGTTTNQRSFRATTVHPAAPFVSEIRQCY